MASKRILVVGPSWVGDMVMAQTLFKVLKAQDADVIIDVIAPAWSGALLERMPEVNKALSLPFGHGQWCFSERGKLGRSLKGQYDWAIMCPNSWKSALVPYFAGIKKRTGWRGEMRYGLLNDVRILDKEQYPLMIERFMALALDEGSALEKPYPRPDFRCKQEDVDAAMAQFSLNHDKRILVMCPGAEFGPSKRWPDAYYAEIAKEKIAEGWQVWLFGSPKDSEVAALIQQQTDQGCIDLTGKTKLPQAIDLMSIADLVIANDSGLMHIAAALNRPLVVPYGSTSPKFTPPLSDGVQILQEKLDCSPCFKRECPLGHNQCMKDLTPEKVSKACDTIINP